MKKRNKLPTKNVTEIFLAKPEVEIAGGSKNIEIAGQRVKELMDALWLPASMSNDEL